MNEASKPKSFTSIGDEGDMFGVIPQPRTCTKGERIVWFFLFLILVFGFRPVRSVLAVAPLVCHRCDVRAEQRVIRRSVRLTVFFIPILPLWTSYLLQCSNCAAETRVTEDQAQRAVEWARSHPVG